MSETDNKSILSESLPEDTDNTWIHDMYADTPEFQEYIKSLNSTDEKNNLAPKIIGKEFVEFKDEKNNPIKVPSEKYVKSLEEKVQRLEEIMRVQNNQINFLNNKFVNMQAQLKTLHDILGQFGGDQF